MHLELSTNEVIEWLKYYDVDYIRINDDITNHRITLILGEKNIKKLKINNVNLDNIKAVWYRRGGKLDTSKWFSSDFMTAEIFQHLVGELKTTKEAFLYTIFKDKKKINSPFNSHLNKIEVLQEAQILGIHFPYTIISTSKNDLMQNLDTFKKYIVKPINKIQDIEIGTEKYHQLTSGLSIENLQNLSEDIFPCIIQELVTKSFEIRAFYLNNKFYSMAIFSQENPKTVFDFRNYDYENPNRFVPFQLDKDYEEKLKQLLLKLKLNCASLDILRGVDGKYYFLEINPVGQFGMVSYPCNYFLEKEFAHYLKS
jgi:ATP-GRASP peptide maturase of grasp-with-spasm system